MEFLKVDPSSDDRSWLARAVAVLEAGGVVAYPTDTLYGLAVDPRRDDAVERLFKVKERGSGMALPVIAGSIEQAGWAGRFGDTELRLAAAFWPGPLSIVVAASSGISSHLLGPGRTVAVRVPAHVVARDLALAFGYPITATSANISGSPPAATPDAVIAGLGDRIDAVVDAGPTGDGPPSTIVEVSPGGPRLLRAGPVAWERVLEFLQ